MPAEPSRGTLRERLHGWLPVLVVAAVLAVAGVVAIPLGGWDTVQLQSAVVPQQEAGVVYGGNRLATSVDEAYLTDENPDGITEPDPGETYLVVVATMENTTDEPQPPLGSRDFYAITVPGVLELGTAIEYDAHAVYLVRDESYFPTLNPGIPDEVLFLFTVPDDLFAPGDELVVGITDADPEPADLYLGTRWVDPHVAVEVPLTIGRTR